MAKISLGNFTSLFFLRIIFILNLFIADAIFGDEFSLQLLDGSEYYYTDANRITDQSTFYRCSDKTNIVTINPQSAGDISSRLNGVTTILSSNNRNIGNRLFGVYDSDDKSLRTWISNFGNWTELDNVGNSGKTFTFCSYGFAVGIDRLIDRKFLVGITFGSDRTTVSLPQSRDVSFIAGHGHVYFRTIFQRLYIDVESGIGLGSNTQTIQNALSKGSSAQWNFQVEAGTWSYEGLMKVEPFASLQHASLLNESHGKTRSAAIAGVRCSWQSAGLFSVSTPRFYGGIIREFGNSNVAATSLFTDSPTIFVTQNQKIAKTRFFGGCGTTASMGSTLEIYFRYTAEAASHYASHTLLIGMNWIF
ncbi:MAG: autotransporter outer membrane beta-barrel domain-containing protein [Planctomycetaceae bacterium]|jgi:outer membrane autotransporter protein|nr:autotransporter outer membrane beta-barrel domain-containing protein [Planctomycetaceae bacterium]